MNDISLNHVEIMKQIALSKLLWTHNWFSLSYSILNCLWVAAVLVTGVLGSSLSQILPKPRKTMLMAHMALCIQIIKTTCKQGLVHPSYPNSWRIWLIDWSHVDDPAKWDHTADHGALIILHKILSRANLNCLFGLKYL